MAICRWSDENFTCDLYIYHHVHGGLQLDVAGNRYAYDRSKAPRWAETPSLDADDSVWAAWSEIYAQQRAQLRKLMEEGGLEPINGPYDGHHENFEDPESLIEFIEKELIPAGYEVPRWVIPTLKKYDMHQFD